MRLFDSPRESHSPD